MAKTFLRVFIVALLVGLVIVLVYQEEVTFGLRETLSLHHQESDEFLLSHKLDKSAGFNLENFKYSSYYDEGFYNAIKAHGKVTATSRVKHFKRGGTYVWSFSSITTKDKVKDIDAASIVAVKVMVNSRVLPHQPTRFYELGEKQKYSIDLIAKEKGIVPDENLYFIDFLYFNATPITEDLLPLEKVSIELSIRYYQGDTPVKEKSYSYDMDIKTTSQYLHYGNIISENYK